MLIDATLQNNGLMLISVSGSLTHASAVQSLGDVVARTHLEEGNEGLLFDLSKLSRLNMAGLAALVEIVARYPKLDLAFCGMPEKHMIFLRKSGLDRGLTLFSSINEALSHPLLKRHTLRNTRAVLLCSGQGAGVSPISNVMPTPMFNITGMPAFHRVMDHLRTCGIRDVMLNPGHLGYQVINYCRNRRFLDTQISFLNEGHWSGSVWTSAPIGSASILKRMQVETSAFDTDFIVLPSDTLIDLDFVDMMQEHRKSGALMTMAVHAISEDEHYKHGCVEKGAGNRVIQFLETLNSVSTPNHVANTGIYIMNADVLSLIDGQKGQDIARDLLPKIINRGGGVRFYDKSFSKIDLNCGRDYAAVITKSLFGELPVARPIGTEIRPNVWAMPGASISSKANITGPCHIGAGARIEAGAHLSGVCSIGNSSTVEGGTVLRDTIVMPDTIVGAGAWAEQMILHGDWAIDHTRADGSKQIQTSLDGVRLDKLTMRYERRASA